MYDQIQRPENNIAVSPSGSWAKDFMDPISLLHVTFHGDHIPAMGNINWSELNDPKINAAIDKAITTPAGEKRNKVWAEVNHKVTAQAPAIPWVWDDNFQFASKDVNAVMNGYNAMWDLPFVSLKK